MRQADYVFRARRELGEVFLYRGIVDDEPIVFTSHPDHVRSLFTAKPDVAPSLTAESPLRPIVGLTTRAEALGAQQCASASCCAARRTESARRSAAAATPPSATAPRPASR